MPLPEDFLEEAERLRNWGRWGDADEIGTLNLIDGAARRRGAEAVKDGKAFSMAMPLQENGIQQGWIPGRVNPLRTMTQVNHRLSGDPDGVCSSDDVVFMALQAATHWDSLAHVSYGGNLWNGHPASSITAEMGATVCGIDKVRTLTSRGVLLDVARARGVDRLEGATAIGPDDLDAALELAKTTIEPGDVVLVRTGAMTHLKGERPNKIAYVYPAAGLGMAAPAWFHARDVAAVATDTMVFEVYPWERAELEMPVHLLDIVEMGMTQGQNFDMEDLAADCAEDGRYTFLLEASPQPFVGGVGSPVNPVAVK